MKPTREEVIRVARELGFDCYDSGHVEGCTGAIEALAQHFYESGKREFEDKAWKLIDELENVRGARTRGEEDWKALNKADADLRRELQQATGEKA